jgi:hypothetical protein
MSPPRKPDFQDFRSLSLVSRSLSVVRACPLFGPIRKNLPSEPVPWRELPQFYCGMRVKVRTGSGTGSATMTQSVAEEGPANEFSSD